VHHPSTKIILHPILGEGELLIEFMKKILIYINPKSRSGREAFAPARDAIKKAGIDFIHLNEEEKQKNPNDLIKKYQHEVDAVLIGGGDGSINYVLATLVETQVPLLLFPLGTANNLARSLELPFEIDGIIDTLKRGEIISLDLGMVNNLYFINVAGLGISAEVNDKVSGDLKKKTGPLAFWFTALKLGPSFKPFKAKITVDNNQPFWRRTRQISICNGKHYASWMVIDEDATYFDEKLHGLSTEVKKWWQWFKLLPSFFKGRYKEEQEVSNFSGEKIKIETNRQLVIDVDGDIQTTTPALFEVKPKAFKLMVPAHDRTTLF
jgi:diacylglycerol kinase (ATP)